MAWEYPLGTGVVDRRRDLLVGGMRLGMPSGAPFCGSDIAAPPFTAPQVHRSDSAGQARWPFKELTETSSPRAVEGERAGQIKLDLSVDTVSP